ncbi:MAG: hypothetical protein LBG27_07585 [Spirochaetaceae bacterium]|nr:hypothetical protein [Spirochaetaceae bacterium]
MGRNPSAPSVVEKEPAPPYPSAANAIQAVMNPAHTKGETLCGAMRRKKSPAALLYQGGRAAWFRFRLTRALPAYFLVNAMPS